MNFYGAVVANEAQFPEFVHELTHSRACCADHLRQRFLAEFSHNRLRLAFFAETCEEKEKSGEPLLARIEQLIDQLFNSSEKRLARLLLLLANFGKEGRPEPIVGKFSQEMLADMIGTTRSRVSKFMNKFRELGFISYNGTIEVHSSLLGVLLHDQPQIKASGEAVDAE